MWGRGRLSSQRLWGGRVWEGGFPFFSEMWSRKQPCPSPEYFLYLQMEMVHSGKFLRTFFLSQKIELLYSKMKQIYLHCANGILRLWVIWTANWLHFGTLFISICRIVGWLAKNERLSNCALPPLPLIQNCRRTHPLSFVVDSPMFHWYAHSLLSTSRCEVKLHRTLSTTASWSRTPSFAPLTPTSSLFPSENKHSTWRQEFLGRGSENLEHFTHLTAAAWHWIWTR